MTSGELMSTSGRVIHAGKPVGIRDLVPGTVIYRSAKAGVNTLMSELPCHPDQVASIVCDPGAAGQQVVCRTCFISYIATSAATFGSLGPRISYRMTGRVVVSRPRRPREIIL